jgi:hypothetical protein
VIGTHGPLRVRARIQIPGRDDVCRLGWPTSARLLVVLTRGGACYSVFDVARIVTVDPSGGRVVAQRRLSGRAMVVATATTSDGLALLLAAPDGESRARLLLVSPTATRTIPLPKLSTRARPLDKSILGTAIGLAVDREKEHSYVVEPGGRFMDVDQARGAVRIHTVAVRQVAATLKGDAGTFVQALALGRGRLGVAGIRRAPGGGLVPLGLRLIDTRTLRSRLVDAEATGIASVGTILLAFQPRFDQLVGHPAPIGLRGYSPGGAPRFRLFRGRSIDVVRVHGPYAYIAGLGSGAGSVVDVPSGRVQGPISISPYELLAGAGPS